MRRDIASPIYAVLRVSSLSSTNSADDRLKPLVIEIHSTYATRGSWLKETRPPFKNTADANVVSTLPHRS